MSESEYIQEITSSQGRLLAYIRKLVPSPADAADILQETNVVLWTKINSFEPGSNFRAWSYTIAYNQCLAFFKRKKIQSHLIFDDELLNTLASEAADKLNEFEVKQQYLESCIANLSDQDQQILKQRYFKKESMKDFAKSIGRSSGALKQVLIRIRHNLRDCLKNKLKQELYHD